MNAIYARVSTDEQARSGYSLQDQVEACRNRLISLGLTDYQEYIDDGYSGEFLDRPALDQLRRDLESRRIKSICIYDPDRLSRNLTNQLLLADEIEKAGAKLLFITGDYDASPEGRLFFSIRGAISAFEKAKIRERTIRGKQAKARAGRIIQNAKPFGYDWDTKNSTYIISPTEAKTVQLMYDLLIKHKLGTYAIAQELKRLGLKGKKGRFMAPETINKILKKEMYYGDYYHFRVSTRKTGQKEREIKKVPQAKQIKIQIPPIITKEVWQAAQAQLAANRCFSIKNVKHPYLLRSLLYCPYCGRSLTAFHSHQSFYYLCLTVRSSSYSGQICPNRRIRADELDQHLWEAICQIIKNSPYLEQVIAFNDAEQILQTKSRLEIQYNQLLSKQTEISIWFQEDLLPKAAAYAQLKQLKKELASLELSLQLLQDTSKLSAQAAGEFEQLIQTLGLEHKRLILARSGYRISAAKTDDHSTSYWIEY